MQKNSDKILYRGIVLILAVIFSMLAFSACTADTAGKSYFIEFELSDDVYVDGERLSGSEVETLRKKISELLREIENQVSVEKSDSNIYALNIADENSAVAVGEHTYSMLMLCKQLYEETGGAFSPSLFSLSELWGFSPDREGHYSDPREEPSAESIEEILAFSDFSSVHVQEDNTVIKEDSRTKLDLGGIAKGYMSDAVASLIQSLYPGQDVECAISVMSNTVLLGGKHESTGAVRGYNVGIENPRKLTTNVSDGLYIVGAADVAISTSADNYRFYVNDGNIYSHIIDPSTGRPSNNGVSSITVLVPASVMHAGALADAYSTAGFCMPLTQALALYEELWEEKGIGAVVITSDFRYYVAGDYNVLNRKEYAQLTAPQLADTTENIFTYAQISLAEDAVKESEAEREYIQRVTELA